MKHSITLTLLLTVACTLAPRIDNAAPNAEAGLFATMGIEFVHVRGGTFEMGDIFGDSEEGKSPLHEVTLSDYYIATTEITFAQYDRFCQATGKRRPHDAGWGRGERPVIDVDWFDAREFCRWLSAESGRDVRLPTEAEWEFAARERGKRLRFGNGGNIGDPALINCAGIDEPERDYLRAGPARGMTLPVAGFPPNALGLHDMSGNVWEWCSDWYAKDYYDISPARNPRGEEFGRYRVIRGGSFDTKPMRNDARGAYSPGAEERNIGFRLTMSGGKQP